MNTTDIFKQQLKLFKLIFSILLYIHITSCIWFFMINNHYEDYKWWLDEHDISKNNFDALHWEDKWLIIFYHLMLALLSSDISYGSINTYQFITLSIFLLAGALENAYIFGTWSFIIDALNIKTVKYEEF